MGHGIASGGTLFGNGMSVAAAKAALQTMSTDDAYSRTADLKVRLADGIESSIIGAGLPWSVQRLWPCLGITDADRIPANAIGARRSFRQNINELHRVSLANRRIWEAISSAGPCVSVAAFASDVDAYLGVFAELVKELTV